MGILDNLNPFVAGGYDPNVTDTTNAQGMNLPNLFMTQPGLINSIMTPEQQQQLQSQATKRGLLTGALTYLATPKNLGLGSPVPYLSKAYLGGMQGAQSTYDVASKNLTDVMTLQRLGKQIELQGMTGGERAQKYYNDVFARYQQDPENPQLKQELINAKNQLNKETTFAPPNIVFQQQGEEAKAVGKYYGDTYTDLQKGWKQDFSRVQKLERATQLIGDIETGKLTKVGLEGQKLFDSLGIPISENAGKLEAAQSIYNQVALEFRTTGEGAGMPGSLSDSDRAFLVEAAGTISNTPEGRRLMLDTAKKLAERKKLVARKAVEYRRKNGQLDEGFELEMMDYADANPLFPTEKGTSISKQPMVGGDIQPQTSGGFRIID